MRKRCIETPRIAVIADTHDRLRPELLAALRGAAEIWHLGDVCSESIAAELAAIGPPLVIVRGNNDFCPAWPEKQLLRRAGHEFLLQHHPPHRSTEVEFLLHGHTHVPRDEMVGVTRVLNPGAAGLANKGAPRSFAWLEVDEQAVRWRIQLL